MEDRTIYFLKIKISDITFKFSTTTGYPPVLISATATHLEPLYPTSHHH